MDSSLWKVKYHNRQQEVLIRGKNVSTKPVIFNRYSMKQAGNGPSRL